MGHRQAGRMMARPGSDAALALRVIGLFRPFRRRLLVVLAVVVVTQSLGTGTPLLMREAVDRALFCGAGCPDYNRLLSYVGLMSLIPVLGSAMTFLQVYQTNVIGQRVMRDLRVSLYRHLQRQSFGFFTQARSGDVQSRLISDINSTQFAVTDTAASTLRNVILIATRLAAMVLLSWQLTVVVVVILPLFAVLCQRVGRVQRRISADNRVSMPALNVIAQETLSVSGFLLTKLSHSGDAEVERFSAAADRLERTSLRRQMGGIGLGTSTQAFFAVMPALLLLAAGYLLFVHSPVSAGTLLAFMIMLPALANPVVSLLDQWVQLHATAAVFERVFEYLDLKPAIVDRPGARALDPGEVGGRVTFSHVYFRYPAEKPAAPAASLPPWVLSDIDFQIRPGQLVALVGPTGAGKTTVSYLVPRLFDVNAGSVALDGVDVRDLTSGSLLDAIGVVTQETHLFHASVRFNILYGRPDATQMEIEACARAALIHDVIAALPDGYDTLVGERGYRLSGGERQRLAIARVMLKNPRMLLLDEATSALDTASERVVQAALRRLMEGRTTLAIAHRLSTIRSADLILTLQAGKIVERGTHDELLALGGVYANLYQQQFREGLVEAQCADGTVLSDGRVVTGAPIEVQP